MSTRNRGAGERSPVHRTDSKLTTYVDNVGDGHPGVIDICVICKTRWPCDEARQIQLLISY